MEIPKYSHLAALTRRIGFVIHHPVHRHARLAVGVLLLLPAIFVGIRMLPMDGPRISMRIHASQPGVAQWFLNSGRGYTERESLTAALRKGDNLVQFVLPPGTYRGLRFDPINNDSTVTIQSISITPRAQLVGGGFGLANFASAFGVAKLAHSGDGLKVVPVKGSHDPQLAVTLAQPLVVRGPPRNTAGDAAAAFVLAALVGLLLEAVLAQVNIAQVVQLGLGAAFVLIVVMNLVSLGGGNLHPDEPLHLACFRYYLHHLWPPAAGSPGIVNSIQSSPWGVSYLNSYDVVYFIAGHVMGLFAGIFDSAQAMARAFQNFLWLVLLGLALRKKAWALALAALLVSPQVWYIFSYFNGDAFPFFLCSIAVVLVCDSRGGLARYLRIGGRPTAAAVVFSLCLGLTLVSKSNYAPVVMGLFLWLAVRHMRASWLELVGATLMAGMATAAFAIDSWAGPALIGHVAALLLVACLSGLVALGSLAWRYATQRNVRAVLNRALVLLALVLLFAAPRVINDLYINGGPSAKAATIMAMKEKYASHDFKPSVIEASGGYFGLHFSQNGVSLADMLYGHWHWLAISAKSAFGTYGYMDIWAPQQLYKLIWLAALILAVASVAALLRRRGAHGAKQLFVVFGIAALVLFSSMLYSWLYAFQPQGRYLLPAVLMFALLLDAAMPLLPPRFVKLMLVAMLVLSAWSFVGIGIPTIAAKAV